MPKIREFEIIGIDWNASLLTFLTKTIIQKCKFTNTYSIFSSAYIFLSTYSLSTFSRLSVQISMGGRTRNLIYLAPVQCAWFVFIFFHSRLGKSLKCVYIFTLLLHFRFLKWVLLRNFTISKLRFSQISVYFHVFFL